MIVLAAFAAYLVATLVSARRETLRVLDWSVQEHRDAVFSPRQAPIVLTADERLECALFGVARGFLWPLWVATWLVKLGARILASGHSPLEKLELQKAELAKRERDLAEAERQIDLWMSNPSLTSLPTKTTNSKNTVTSLSGARAATTGTNAPTNA